MTTNILNKYIQWNKWQQALFHFVLFIIVFFAIQLIIKEFFITDHLLHEHLSENFSEASVAEKMKSYQDVTLLTILVPVAFYLLRFGIIAIFVLATTLLENMKHSFLTIFKAVVLAEYIYIIKQTIKLIWFGFIHTDYTYKTFYDFHWDYVKGWLDISNLPVYFRVPLNTINIFTILYFFVLAYFLKREFNKENTKPLPYSKSLNVSFKAFGTGLVLWIVFIMFIITTLN